MDAGIERAGDQMTAKLILGKEVSEEIRTFAYDTFKEFGCFDETDLEHILDQIQGETK